MNKKGDWWEQAGRVQPPSPRNCYWCVDCVGQQKAGWVFMMTRRRTCQDVANFPLLIFLKIGIIVFLEAIRSPTSPEVLRGQQKGMEDWMWFSSLLAEDHDVQRVNKDCEQPFELMVSETRADFLDTRYDMYRYIHMIISGLTGHRVCSMNIEMIRWVETDWAGLLKLNGGGRKNNWDDSIKSGILEDSSEDIKNKSGEFQCLQSKQHPRRRGTVWMGAIKVEH